MGYDIDKKIVIRKMQPEDVPQIVEGETAQGWQVTADKYETRLQHQSEGRSAAFVAEYNGTIAGYINLYYHAKDGAFAEQGYPEIKDFGVLEKYRNKGIGGRLMDAAEQLAAKHSYMVCLGVGLHSGYGSAQRMYVKRGYVFDGSGVWYQERICEPYSECCNDDDLVLYMSKRLK